VTTDPPKFLNKICYEMLHEDSQVNLPKIECHDFR
jgi:hypothetical protein